MSEKPDKDSKTEEATEKKIADAIEKGNTPFSREATIFASMLAILVVLALFAQSRVSALTGTLAHFIDDPGGFSLNDGTEATQFLWAVSWETGRAVLPAILILALFGIAGSLFQNAPSLVLERIRPQWSRISPAAGWSRIFGRNGQIEFLRSLFKVLAVGAVCVFILRGDLNALISAMYTDPTLLPALVLSMVVRLVSAVAVATIVIVIGDLVWSRVHWRTELRMTRHEIKEELKQSEGDPLVKGRLRSIARSRARQRMIAAVPRATLVIANPTHYAVALRYVRSEKGAPLVVAKGADLVALKIRELAESHGIPVIEDKPLARALYAAVEVDRCIPAEFYHAVAKLLHYIYARNPYAAR